MVVVIVNSLLCAFLVVVFLFETADGSNCVIRNTDCGSEVTLVKEANYDSSLFTFLFCIMLLISCLILLNGCSCFGVYSFRLKFEFSRGFICYFESIQHNILTPLFCLLRLIYLYNQSVQEVYCQWLIFSSPLY